MNIKTFLTALFFLVTLGLSAQSNTEGEAFHLTKQGAHYVFNASINGKADATILLESGIPALLADSAYVFSSGILSDMELIIADKEKLNLAGRVYKITHKANGTVRIGNSTSYIGEVFVLSNYDYGTYNSQWRRRRWPTAGRCISCQLSDRVTLPVRANPCVCIGICQDFRTP